MILKKNEVPLISAINNIYLNEDYSQLDELLSKRINKI